jgi:hypothetical protein
MKKEIKKSEIKTVKIEPKPINLVADVKDPQVFPWLLAEGSASEVTCVGVFEFIPGVLRGKFMDEIYRILIPGGKAAFKVPFYNTAAAIQDYTLAWPPLSEASFCYFDKAQRESIGLKREIVCDFEVAFGYDVPPDIATKNDETRSFNIRHYTNVVQALNVVLTKRIPKI